MPKVSRVGKFRKTANAAATKTKAKEDVEMNEEDGKIHVPKLDPIVKDVNMEGDAKGQQPPSFLKALSSKKKKRVAANLDYKPTIIGDESMKSTNNATTLSRGQRRRQAKRDQYLRKEKMILSSLKLKKEEEQKKRIDGLDALKEALMETVNDKKEKKGKEPVSEEKKSTITIKSNKAKQTIVASEVSHMGLVLQHPAFQSNPFEALQTHLKNTLAGQSKAQEQAAKERIKAEQEAATKRKQEKKERLKGRKKTRSKFKATRSRGK